MVGTLRRPLVRTSIVFAILALGYWGFEIAILGPGIQRQESSAIAIAEALMAMGQWIPNLHSNLNRLIELFGIDAAQQYARVLTVTSISDVMALLCYAATWSWRPLEKLEWVPGRSIGNLERHRAIGTIGALSTAYMLFIGFGLSSHSALTNIAAPTADPLRMLLSPIGIGFAFALCVANVVEQTFYIRGYRKLLLDPEAGPKI